MPVARSQRRHPPTRGGNLLAALLFSILLVSAGGFELSAQPERLGAPLPTTTASPFDQFNHALDGEYFRAWGTSFSSDFEDRWSSYERLVRSESALYAGLEEAAHGELALLAAEGANSAYRADAGLRKGLIELKKGDHHHARLTLNDAIEEVEGRADGGVVIGEALFWIGASHLIESGRTSYNQALSLFSESLRENPRGSRADDALYYSGQINEASEKVEAALANYTQLLLSYPESDYRIAASVRRIQLLNLLRKYDDAFSALDEVETLWTWHKKEGTEKTQRFHEEVDLELVLLRGDICIGRRDHPGAERAYLTLLYTLDGGYRRAGTLGLAETYRVAGMVDSAIVHYDRLIREDRDDEIGEKAAFYRGVALTSGRGAGEDERRQGIEALQEIYENNLHLMRENAALALADLALRGENYERAHDLTSAVLATGDDQRLRARAGVIGAAALIGLGHPTEGVRLLENARTDAEAIPSREMPEGPALVTTSFRMEGIARLQSNDYDGALLAFDRYRRESHDSSTFAEIVWLQAEAESRAGRGEASIERLEELVAEYPGSLYVEGALYTIGWSRLRSGELKSAESAFARLVKAYPLSPYGAESQIRRGDCFYLNKQFVQASELYGDVAGYTPSPSEQEYAAYQGSMATWLAGEITNARASFALFVENHPRSEYADDALFMNGLLDYRDGEFEDAIVVMRQLLERYHDSRLQARAYYTIADAYYRLGHFTEALAAYSIVTERYPNSSYLADAETGIVYARAAHEKLLDTERLGALQVADADLSGRVVHEMELRRGAIFLDANRPDEAAREYHLFIEKNQESANLPAAWLGLAEVELLRGDTAAAIDTLRAALNNFTEGNVLPMATLRLSELQTVHGDTAGAIHSLAQIRERFPESAALAVSLLREADLHLATGDEEGARKVLRYGAERLDTVTGFQTRSGGDILWRLARLETRAGDIESARLRWRLLAQRSDSIGAEGTLLLAESLQNEGRTVEALELYRAAPDRFRVSAELKARYELGLGRSLEMAGETAEAAALYRAIVERHAEDSHGSEAARRLVEMSTNE